MRGEQSAQAGRARDSGGSSPHAWGTVSIRPHAQPAGRFIPTCVGNRPRHGRALGKRTVHPHMRGEQFDSVVSDIFISGSSPHAWGTAQIMTIAQRFGRFIPTCVGNRTRKLPTRAHAPVHPHMRGEQVRIGLLSAGRSGSSPHAWGTGGTPARNRARRRFIPTCVGNSAGRNPRH